ncbi:MAG: type III-B CRISPR module RAMP protein Cmr1 [Caldisericia bacterium]|nr:type III-B CRISPR module RAMP protein Cmr1 [Caldisericia bacterium]
MEKIVFECETITPMFIAGADSTTPELRAPSIKGAMRFWWRAVNGHLSVEDLRTREAEIFGGSGDGQGRSKVIVRVENRTLNSSDISEQKPVPHKGFKINAINTGKIFNVELCLIKSKILYNNQEIFDLEKLKSLFILVSILGGIGKRERRGFGSFKINSISINDKNIENLIFSAQNLLGLLNKFENGGYVLDTQNNNKIVLIYDRNYNYPYIKFIEIGQNNNNLLLKISNSSHNNNSDYTGYAKREGRFSSPEYVSIINKENNNVPIITSLNHNYINLSGTDKSSEFRRDIL